VPCFESARALLLRVLSRPELSGHGSGRRRRARLLSAARSPAALRTGSIDAPVTARGRAPRASADWPGNSDCMLLLDGMVGRRPGPARRTVGTGTAGPLRV
jgi:hypothetical protein